MTEPSLRLPDDPDPDFAPRAAARGMEPALTFPSLVKLALAVAVVVAVSVLGQLGTMRGLAGWYPALVKPGFTPPNWVFPVAWSALFALMAWAFWRVLRLPAATPGRSTAIALFASQLVLNVAWSWAFFGFRTPIAGLAVILALEIAIIATIRAFLRLDRPAAMMLWPYAGWVAYASVLNAAIVWLNR